MSQNKNGKVIYTKPFSYNENLLKDHKIFGEQVLLGFAHCSLVLQALNQLSFGGDVTLSKVSFLDAVHFSPLETINVNVIFKQREFLALFENSYFKQEIQKETISASGQIVLGNISSFSDERIIIPEWINRAKKTRSGDTLYHSAANKFFYGDSFFSVKNVHVLVEAVFSEIELTSAMKEEVKFYPVHPAVLDAIHVTAAFAMDPDNPSIHHWIPFFVQKLQIHQPIQNDILDKLYCYAKPVRSNSEIKEFDCKLYNKNGDLIINIEGFYTKQIPSKEALFGTSSITRLPARSQPIQISEVNKKTEENKPSVPPDNNSISIQEKILEYVKKKVAKTLRKSIQEIEETKNFMDMGVDSQKMTGATKKMEEEIGIELLPTLFFEYQNIKELSDFFAAKYARQFDAYFGLKQSTQLSSVIEPVQNSLESVSAQKQEVNISGFSLSDSPIYSSNDIAIIGMNGRLAQSPDLRSFWKHILESRDLITEIPKNRWDYQPWFDEKRPSENKTYSKWGSFLEDVDQFDPLFFGISPQQAVWLDPQARILLEVVYGALEDAGYINRIKGSKTGIYVGVCFREYWDEIVRKGIPMTGFEHLSSVLSGLSGIVSYTFDLQGPNIPLDNACASSLTAMHLACQALKTGECDQAFVAGTNLLLSPLHYLYFSNLQALSPTGRCHTFDKQADGYVPGEGIFAILLKPLSKAIRDRDNIHAVVKGTAINHVGRSNNPTSPRPELQTAMLLEAWKNANISPETLSYMECHGTGTPLGDPIEISALQKAFRKYTEKTNFCAIGSTKAHIGHLEGAAGLASVTKVVLSMKHRTIPIMPNFKELNPIIQLAGSPFYINSEVQEWKTQEGIPRRAGVSSFGMTGNNAHVVIEEYIPNDIKRSTISITTHRPAIIILSARNEERLKEQAKRLLAAIHEQPLSDTNLLDIAYTLQTSREAMEERLAVIVASINDLEEKLKGFLEDREGVEDLFRGQVKHNKETISVLTEDEEILETIEKWIQRKKYGKLLKLWTKGLTFDWNVLYKDIDPEARPRHISLPSYPFAKERYWIPTSSVINIEPPDEKTPEQAIMLKPVWDRVTVNFGQLGPSSKEQMLVIGGNEDDRSDIRQHFPNMHSCVFQGENTIDEITQKLETCGIVTHIIWLAPSHFISFITEESLVAEQNSGVLQVFRIIKALIRLGYDTRNLDWTFITRQTQPIHATDAVNPTYASLHGLVGSMAKEYLNWKIRCIDLELGVNWPLPEILTLPAEPPGELWVYRNHEWYQKQLYPVHFPPRPLDRTIYKTGGVYVVIGGAGGIGEIWSEYMIRAYKAQIVWIGRRQKDAVIQNKIDRLTALGPEPCYIAADATDIQSLGQAHTEIKQRYPRINGIIHSAMVLADQSLANMDVEQFRAGLTAKVDVSVRMAQVFENESLDFVMFFSSFNSFLKSPGQSNYVAGCTFVDAFAHQLTLEWSCPVKVMNWGYWGSVGVVASKTYQDRMARLGIGSIEPSEAMEAIEKLLTGPFSHMAFLKATKKLPLEELNLNINTGELITVYPHQGLGVNLQRLRDNISNYSLQINDIGLGDKKSEEHFQMDGLLCRLLWGQLQSLGIFTDQTHPYSRGSMKDETVIANLAAKTGVLNLYTRWFEESISILECNHYLKTNGKTWVAVEPAPIDMNALWQEWDLKKYAWLKDLNLKPKVVLVESTLKVLAEILTGKLAATEVIFPGSSIKLLEGIYKQNPVADYFNEVLSGAVITYIEERIKQDPFVQIRIIEIGAGTGGTSVMVFQKLKPYREHIQEYCYTDISKAFLLYAEKEYGPQNPYLTYQIFDVGEPVIGQKISANGYDLVIAANVLHATKNIRQTLRNVKTVLKSNGLLLLNELSANTLFTHLTFGLLEGWWLYDDTALRIPGCPLLSPETWSRVLASEGFHMVFTPSEKMFELGQQIIVAQSDGAVRQKLESATISQCSNRQGITSETQNANTKELHSQHNYKTSPKSEAHNIYARSLPVFGDTKRIHDNITVTDQIAGNYIRNIICEKLSEVLRVDIDMVDLDESFADYGLDSILGVRLVQAINQNLALRITNTNLFDYSSVNRLTKYILSEYKDTITAVLGQNRQQVSVNTLQNENDNDNDNLTGYKIPESIDNPSTHMLTGKVVSDSEVLKKDEGNGDIVQRDPIAIIGMSGRFPKSKTVNELWNHLANGTDLVEEVTRWDLAECFPEEAVYCNQGSFLDDIDKFDSLFFNISGMEATYMDPQQRIFLQEAWHALEDAGYAGKGVQGRVCGVYAGYNIGDYQDLFMNHPSPPAQAMWGNAGSILSARIAYFLDLQGPAITIDTACSSSLVAVHLACQGLWVRETELALAGGAFIQCTPKFYLTANRAGMLSSTGRCHTFDEQADGFIPGEGIAVVVLKRLQDALRDGDHIYGVIRGSGINQDGTTNGITAPSAKSQERLERYVYDTFKVNPEQIQMVEAHGTGTILGDPIEFEALTRSFRAYTNKKGYCAIGTIKTNIGHTTAAAGVAGLIKILLALQHKQIPPSLHFQSGNSSIEFIQSPFYVNSNLRNWESEPGFRRTAIISAFGFSGTNAHMVIEEAPELERQQASAPEKPGYLIALSARTAEQLQQQAQQLIAFCEQANPMNCGDISFTLLLGRKHFNHRLAFIVRDRQELISLLKKWLEKGKVPQILVSELSENEYREQSSLKQYGNQCIQACGDNKRIGNSNIYLEHLSMIAELYIQGYELEFEKLFSKEFSRISLPPYPFAKESYWIPECYMAYSTKSGSSGASKATSIASSTVTSLINESETQPKDKPVSRRVCFLKKQWEPCFAAPNNNLRADSNRTVVILTTQETEGLAIQIAQHFSNSKIIGLNDLGLEIRKLEIEGQNYGVCVDLTGCAKAETRSLGLITFLQLLVERGLKDGLILLCVTKGLELYQNTMINLSGAFSVGLYRMFQSEYRNLQSRHIDVEPSIEDRALAELIASEFLIDSEDAEICYRNGKRYRAYLDEFKIKDTPVRTIMFPDDQVLLITGGTRGLGYLCAQHFITHYGVKRLAIFGREKLPPREQWNSVFQNNTTTQKIRGIQALEAQDIQVKVFSDSLADEQAIKRCLEEIKSTMGPIGGIIHCGGIVDFDNPAFVRKPIDSVRRVLEPKITGLEILYRNSIQEPLQFFVLFSSVAAIVPALASGESDYAMANAFMDYFASAKTVTTNETKNHVSPIISIEWPCWKDTGMGEVKTKIYRQTGFMSLTDTEGLKLLDLILSQKLGPVVLPAVVNSDLWNPRKLMQHITPEKPVANIQPQHLIDNSVVNNSDNLVNATENWLTALFSLELNIAPSKLSLDNPFQDYGVDSIFLAQVIKRIDHELGQATLEPSIFLEYPTIKSLAGKMIETYPEVLMSLFAVKNETLENVTQQINTQHLNSSSTTHPERTIAPENKIFYQKNKIAVVGMACHLPGAENISDFWQNMRSGKDSIREIPASRWDWRQYYDLSGNGKSVSKWGAFLTGIDEFDPGYFKISESLALQVDPLQRQWLEVSAEALADAGYTKEDLWGKQVGVFAGARTANFSQKLGVTNKDTIIGIGENFITAHLAHIYNFKGPNMVVDTACSSSLTAIHLAVKSLQNGEAEIALAGGVEILDESVFLILTAAKILSPEGRCKTFDATADGIGLGEGCGVLVLKPLQKAISDHDKIYGVIDGSAVNNDGNTMGVTTPNPEAQRELIESAIADGGINPKTITYVETHGTGTLIGDPIELKGLTKIFSKYTTKKQFCGVGSVKSNMGHLLSAAGAASIIKVLLAITHQELPPTLHCQNPNPRFNFKESPLYPVQELKKWISEYDILRSGISAFGLGGNNAHIIISNEGVPETHKASVVPKNPKIVFNRNRYWPEVSSPQRQKSELNQKLLHQTIINGDPSPDDEQEAFLELFDLSKVELESDDK